MSESKNLIIDGQLLQTGAWHRGMGKYLIQLLAELSKEATPKTKLHIIFNSQLGDSADRKEVVKYFCPNATIHTLNLPLPTQKNAEVQFSRKIEAFITSNFTGQECHYLVTALFMFDYVVAFPGNAYKLLLFYDLTPLMFWRDLGGYFPPDLYMGRFRKILEADHIYSISQTTKEDLIRTFWINDKKITNINGGFTKISEQPTKPTNFNIPRKFILFPTGDLPHKNNTRAVEAFELFNINKEYKLLITSSFNEKSKRLLQGISESIIFTGNVSDDELEWLYENATAVLFSSKYEGLGMPILDAVANAKPVAASDIPVFREMTDNAYYFFNPDDTDAMAKALNDAVDSSTRHDKSYTEVMKKYRWKNTATDVMENLPHNKIEPLTEHQTETQKQKIAIVSIHPGVPGQIGRMAEPLFCRLRERFEIDCYFDPLGLSPQQMERPTFLDYIGARVQEINSLSPWEYRKYKRVIYLIDKEAFSSWIAQIASVLPGIALLDLDVIQKIPQLETVVANNVCINVKAKKIEYIENEVVSNVQKAQITREENIIKHTFSNRAIIRALLKGTNP